ncbi:hypothetical protein JCM21900_006376 [Sporobolomyces salmonicolor]
MCIVFFTSSERNALIVASNRDEFLARPTAPAAWHDWTLSPSNHTPERTERNTVLSGQDLEAGGTWFGISVPSETTTRTSGGTPRRGVMRFATLTNFTETIRPAARPSRGKLVRDFLDFGRLPLDESLETYLAQVEVEKHLYAGFNLLVGQLNLLPSSSDDESAASTPPEMQLAYISNRESNPAKHARVLPSLDVDVEGKGQGKVRGLSNATLEVEEGEEQWPKVKTGAKAVEEAVEAVATSSVPAGPEYEEQLARNLYNALSTAHPAPILHRTHLRHTVLVRPLLLDPKAPLPPSVLPLPPPSNPLPSSSSLPPDSLPPSVMAGAREGDDGARWYATRVQTLLMVERGTGRVTLREREGYALNEEGRPTWSGKERVFRLQV